MQYSTIAARIADVPPPFTRPDANYASVQASLTYSLANYCQPADSVASQVVYSQVSGGWLNVWGQLLGFSRYSSESDSAYQSRVKASLVAPVGSVNAIQSFATSFFQTIVSVTENSPGYTIQVPSFASSGQINAFISALNRIRPAGVPVTLIQTSQSFFFNSYNYFSAPGVAGIYFGGPPVNFQWPLSGGTNNSQPLLPSLILTDPVLNGQIVI